MKKKVLYICAIVCALVLLLTLPISAFDDMKKIEAGTYRFNDVLPRPNGVITQDVNFTCNASVEDVGELSVVCSNIWVNPGDGTWSTPDLVYTVVQTTPDVGLASGARFVVHWAEDGFWNNQYGGEVLQTITIPYDQYVSCEFGVWFAESTVRQGSSVPSDPSVPSNPSEGCSSFNDYTYSCDCGVGYGSRWNGPEIIYRDDDSIAYRDSCKECGTNITYVVWSDHDYVIEVISATCTTAGRIEYTCSNCGDFYVSSETAALGHDFSIPTVYPATCTAAGYTLYTCSRAGCGQVWVDPDSYVAGNHDMKAIKTVHATCTEPGYIDKACSECGKKERTVLNALDHFFVIETIAPTCTEKGYTKNACARCDVSEVVQGSETSAVGHNYSAVIIDGKQYNLCANCLDRVFISDYVPGDPDGNEGDPTCAHEFITMVVPPTCQTQGYTWYECTKCEHSYRGDIKEPVSHQYELQGRIEPTCTNSGMIINTCKLCGDSISADEAYIPPLGHDYRTVSSLLDDDVIITKSECTRCHVTKTETFPTAAGQAQNWLLTVIRGLFSGFIDMYETVANGIEIGGVTAGEVITGSLIISCFLLLLFLLLKILG